MQLRYLWADFQVDLKIIIHRLYTAKQAIMKGTEMHRNLGKTLPRSLTGSLIRDNNKGANIS